MVRDLAQARGKEVDWFSTGGDGGAGPLHSGRAQGPAAAPGPQRRGSRRGRTVEAAASRQAAARRVEVAAACAAPGRGDCRRTTAAGWTSTPCASRPSAASCSEPADERDVARLIFLPGFSTAPIITDVSGRGVGLDVVKSRVEALHGTVDLASNPGAGTRFTLTVPLTLTTLRAVLVRAGDQALRPGRHQRAAARARPGRRFAPRSPVGRCCLWGARPCPWPASPKRSSPGSALPAAADGKVPVVVLAAGDKTHGFRRR